MNPRQILDSLLSDNKSITLEFPTNKSYQSFRASIAVYTARYNKMLAELGEGDIFSGKSLVVEKLDCPKPRVIAKLSLGEKPKKVPQYTILSIDTTPKMDENLADDNKEKAD